MDKNAALMKRICSYLPEQHPTTHDLTLLYLGYLADAVDKASKKTVQPDPEKVPIVTLRVDADALRDAAELIMELINIAKTLQEQLDRIQYGKPTLTVM